MRVPLSGRAPEFHVQKQVVDSGNAGKSWEPEGRGGMAQAVFFIEQELMSSLFGQEIPIVMDAHAAGTAPAGGALNASSHEERIVKIRRSGFNVQTVPADRRLGLELFLGEIDPLSLEDGEGFFQPMLLNAFLQIAVLAACPVQHFPVRAGGVFVNKFAGGGKKGAFTLRDALPDFGGGGFQGERMFQIVEETAGQRDLLAEFSSLHFIDRRGLAPLDQGRRDPCSPLVSIAGTPTGASVRAPGPWPVGFGWHPH